MSKPWDLLELHVTVGNHDSLGHGRRSLQISGGGGVCVGCVWGYWRFGDFISSHSCPDCLLENKSHGKLSLTITGLDDVDPVSTRVSESGWRRGGGWARKACHTSVFLILLGTSHTLFVWAPLSAGSWAPYLRSFWRLGEAEPFYPSRPSRGNEQLEPCCPIQ